MTAACDPKLCKSSVPIFNTIPKERPYRARASYILPYRIPASGHRNLGLDHYQHFQHFSARVRGEEQRFGLSKVESCPSVRVARVNRVKCSSRKSQTP